MTISEIELLRNSLHAELIETHISWVLLSGNYAYKIKKPVIFSFLDFSDIETRRHFCQEEMRLNLRLSDIYLSVEAIRRRGEELTVGNGEGDVIDYAVRMKRMPSGKRMDLMIMKKTIRSEQVSDLAVKVAAFHRGIEASDKHEEKAFIKKRFRDILPVLGFVSDKFGPEFGLLIEKAIAYHESFMEQNFNYLDQRVDMGFKRDVHGDLHCQNIYLLEEPVVFDCIDFNEKYRLIDIISEVAFLCMDLEAYGRNDLSRLFIDTYKREIPCMNSVRDEELFRYYKIYRANVKIKVNGLRCMQAEELGLIDVEKMEMLRSYLLLFREYLR